MPDPQGTSPLIRPEIELQPSEASEVGGIERPLSLWERLINITALRRGAILVALAMIWQAYAVQIENPLMLPTFSSAALPSCSS